MIVPALLTDKREDFIKMLNTCAGFTDYVQIDIMDGEFVPSKSIALNDLEGLHPPIKSEAHLMAKNPLAWLDDFKKFGSKRIVFHFEIEGNHREVIKKIKTEGLGVGIAINPSTEIKDFEPLLPYVDRVLFLSVNPGFYGSSFIPGVLEKLRSFKKFYPEKIAGIDGGIKLNNFKEVVETGVDYICVGSAILNAKDPPREAYLKFLNLFKQMRENRNG